MLGYMTIGTNDLDAALKFYDELLGVCGVGRLMELDGFILYGKSLDDAGLAVVTPYDGNAASIGNGMMAALRMESKDMVNAVYDKAIELGGSDEGPPGDRGDIFYAAYFRDPEGTKFCAFFFET